MAVLAGLWSGVRLPCPQTGLAGAVCTLTPKRMQGILRYLQPRFPGVATELATLARQPDSDLWLERWMWPNEFSMRGYG